MGAPTRGHWWAGEFVSVSQGRSDVRLCALRRRARSSPRDGARARGFRTLRMCVHRWERLEIDLALAEDVLLRFLFLYRLYWRLQAIGDPVRQATHQARGLGLIVQISTRRRYQKKSTKREAKRPSRTCLPGSGPRDLCRGDGDAWQLGLCSVCAVLVVSLDHDLRLRPF